MKCPDLPSILMRMLAHEAELAQMLADDHWQKNRGRRQQLAAEVQETRAALTQFIAGFQIQVKKRTTAPTPAKGCK